MRPGACLQHHLPIGVVSDYRAAFWRAAWPALRRRQIAPIFGMGFVALHLIQFTQKAFGGRQNAPFIRRSNP